MKRRTWHRRALLHAGLIGACLFMLYPLLWMVSGSLKPPGEIFGHGGLLPSSISFSSYAEGWTALGVSFGRFFANSFLVAGLVVVGTTISCSLTAYAFARLNFPFRRTAFALMLMTIMLPGFVTIVPEYIMFQYLGWVNTFLPVTVPAFFAVNGFFVFLNVQFIRGIPRELDEAAEIDGASHWQIWWHIIVPASRAALITTAVFAFVWTWDDFFSQLLYLSDVTLFTVPLALQSFLDSMGESSFGPLLAMSTLALLPAFAIFVLAQRYLVEGIATTGMKG
jgi:multiple sugar transport system permease protein